MYFSLDVSYASTVVHIHSLLKPDMARREELEINPGAERVVFHVIPMTSVELLARPVMLSKCCHMCAASVALSALFRIRLARPNVTARRGELVSAGVHTSHTDEESNSNVEYRNAKASNLPGSVKHAPSIHVEPHKALQTKREPRSEQGSDKSQKCVEVRDRLGQNERNKPQTCRYRKPRSCSDEVPLTHVLCAAEDAYKEILGCNVSEDDSSYDNGWDCDAPRNLGDNSRSGSKGR